MDPDLGGMVNLNPLKGQGELMVKNRGGKTQETQEAGKNRNLPLLKVRESAAA